MTTQQLARFFAKVQQVGACWVWTAYKTKRGEGRFGIGSRRDGTRRSALAYRWLYEQLIGPVQDGCELDHLCRNPSCVNPTHLEPVSHRENVLRGRMVEVTRAFHTGRKRSDLTRARISAAYRRRRVA